MEYIKHHNCFAKRKSHVYCIGVTLTCIELVCRYRGIALGRFAEEMMLALFGRVHINMHMAMVDYTCIVSHDGPVLVAYDY